MIKSKNRSSQQTIYVVKGLKHPLLGRPSIQALNVLPHIDSVTEESEFITKYPTVFSGLGQYGTEYRMEIKPNARPWALSTPRRVAVPYLQKVKEELTRMESLGVISRVDSPTDWCAGMVVVPKPNGKIRICVDLTKLNESVKWE